MWKLKEYREDGQLILMLCGRIECELLAELRKIFESEGIDKYLVLDLKEVKLVDRDGIAFLASCERDGIRLENCPAYIREWITREKESLTSNRPE
jgi:ABC-type transporter Mla MlaB component